MKKSFKRMPVLVFAIVLVMLAATALAATNLFGGIVDWDGNYTEATEVLHPTPAPDEEGADAWIDLHRYLEDVPDGEYWEIWYHGGGSGIYGYLDTKYESIEELADAIETKGFNMVNVPENYEATYVEMLCRTLDLERTEYANETVEHDAQLIKYIVETPVIDKAYGYYVVFADENGTEIIVEFSLHDAAQYDEDLSGSFFVEDGESFEVIEDERFDRGIVIKRADGACDIRLQKDIEDGGKIETYNIYSEADISTDDVLNMLFE